MYLLDKLTDCGRRENVVVAKDWLELLYPTPPPLSRISSPHMPLDTATTPTHTTRRNDLTRGSVLL
jgi:hypothetical protein